MRFLGFVVLATVGCGATVTTGGAPDGSVDAPDNGIVDTAFADLPPIPTSCSMVDPLNPPIGCGPVEEGASPCSSTTNVATCPTDNACMAPVKQSGSVLMHRIGRLRLWEPAALVSLTPIAFDPNISAKCANRGSETFSWLLQLDQTTNLLTTGSSRPSSDGRTFSFLTESLDGASLGAICAGFVGPTTPVSLAPIKAPVLRTGTGFITDRIVGPLNLTIFDSSGVPLVMPLREAQFRVPSMADPTCIGKWDSRYWCDGTTLGWSDGGSFTAKISVEDADRVPVKPAGCQSLCAILANDATKIDPGTKACKRGPDGKVPPIGNACIGGVGCNNAWLFSATFGSYGVTITP